MGFKVEFKNNEVLYLKLESPDEAKTSFMQAVELALKRRVIKFEIDLVDHSFVLKEFYIQVIALQKVLAKRGERIRLQSQKPLSAEIENALDQAGVELKIEKVIQALDPSLEDGTTTKPFEISFSEMYEQAKEKKWPKIEHQFRDVYERLRDLIAQERALEKELEFYKKRIVLLRPSIAEKLDLEKLQKKAELQEKPLIELNLKCQSMQNEIQKLSTALQSKQLKYTELIQKLDPQARQNFEESFK